MTWETADQVAIWSQLEASCLVYWYLLPPTRNEMQSRWCCAISNPELKVWVFTPPILRGISRPAPLFNATTGMSRLAAFDLSSLKSITHMPTCLSSSMKNRSFPDMMKDFLSAAHMTSCEKSSLSDFPVLLNQAANAKCHWCVCFVIGTLGLEPTRNKRGKGEEEFIKLRCESRANLYIVWSIHSRYTTPEIHSSVGQPKASSWIRTWFHQTFAMANLRWESLPALQKAGSSRTKT